jgi:polar amino acid transport system substrate-binding protein
VTATDPTATAPRRDRRPRRRSALTAVAIAAAASLALAACGDSYSPGPTSAGQPVQPGTIVSGTALNPPSSSAAPTCNPDAVSQAPSSVAPDAADANSAGVQAIRARGRLIVGVSEDGYLTGYVNPAGEEEGFDIDVARQIEKAIFNTTDDAHIEFRSVTLDQRITDLENGTVDIVVDTMTITCDRNQQIGFSSVYYDAQQRLLVLKDSGISSAADLKASDTVCAQTGSTSIAPLVALSPRPKIYEVTDLSDCLVALQQGEVDAVSTDDTILAGLAAQDPNTEVVGPSMGDDPYGIGVNKSDLGLERYVNSVLAQMRSDGTWAAIYTTWFATSLGSAQPPQAQYSD